MTRRFWPKVLFLTSSYPRTDSDTAAVFLRYLADELAARQIEVHVLAPADGESNSKLEGAVRVHRFQYFPVRWQKLAYGSGIMPNLKREPWLWLQVPCYFLSMGWALRRLLREHKYDLLHAHWLVPQALVGILAKKFYAVPLITTAHGADAFALRGWLSRALKRLAVSHSNAWTANTQATARAIGDKDLPRQAELIPMGVDIARFAQGDRVVLRHGLLNDQFLLLFVGRLIEKKGCHDLLHALSLLSPECRQQITLWIVGDGDQKPALERAAIDLGIHQRIRFWGMIPNQNLPHFYAAADLFIAPSIEARSGDTEGQGVVLLEAFAAGTCVLATRVGGIEDVLHDNVTGILVPPNQPKELAQGIEKLMRDSMLRATLVQNAFAEVNERYAWRGIAGTFANLYRAVLGSARG